MTSPLVNTKEEDFLEVDKPIPGQNFCILSFISPEKVLKQKSRFYDEKFLEYLQKNYLRNKLFDLVYSAYEESLILDVHKKDTQNERLEMFQNIFRRKEGDFFMNESIENIYSNFLMEHDEELQAKFDKEVDFHTNIRGVKVRGVYDSYKEAQIKAKKLQTSDPRFNNYVGQVGYWLPFDPNDDKIENQEYAETQLNTMMKKYNENRDMREEMFRQQNDKKREEAERKAEELRKELNQVRLNEKDESMKKISELRDMVNAKDGMLGNSNVDDNNNDENENVDVQSSENLKKIVKDLF